MRKHDNSQYYTFRIKTRSEAVWKSQKGKEKVKKTKNQIEIKSRCSVL